MRKENQVDEFCKVNTKKSNIYVLSWYFQLLLLWSEEHVAGLILWAIWTKSTPSTQFFKIHFNIIFSSSHILSTWINRLKFFQDWRTAYVFIVSYVLRTKPNFEIFYSFNESSCQVEIMNVFIILCFLSNSCLRIGFI